MITTKSVEFTDANGSLKFEVSSSGGLVVACVGGQPWELTDEQAMEVYALLDQAIVADRWIGASDPSPDDFDRRVTEAFAPKPVPATVQGEERRVPRHEGVVRNDRTDKLQPVAGDFGDLVRNTP